MNNKKIKLSSIKKKKGSESKDKKISVESQMKNKFGSNIRIHMSESEDENSLERIHTFNLKSESSGMFDENSEESISREN